MWVNLASDWHRTPSPYSGGVVHKSHQTKQHTILWNPPNPALSQCCLTQLRHSATVVAGQGQHHPSEGPSFQALLITRRLSSHMGVTMLKQWGFIAAWKELHISDKWLEPYTKVYEQNQSICTKARLSSFSTPSTTLSYNNLLYISISSHLQDTQLQPPTWKCRQWQTSKN